MKAMITELSDAALVGQIGSGEPGAEAELFRRMAPRIRLYGLRHLRDEHAADDLTQQVLLTVLEACAPAGCGSRNGWRPSSWEPAA